MTALRVMFISGEYPPLEGGVGDYTRVLGLEMACQGAVVAVLTSSQIAGEQKDDQLLCLPWVTGWGLGALLPAVRKAAAHFRPDIVHIQYQTAAYQLKPAVNLLPTLLPSLPFATTFHDLREPYLFPKAGRLRRWVTRHLARTSRAVIVTNSEDYQALVQDEKVQHLELIPIGSNIKPVRSPGLEDELCQRWELQRFSLVVGYFGLLNRSKGFDDLVNALNQAVNAGIDAALLVIGGGAGASDPTNAAYLAEVRALIEVQHLTERVIWTGHLAPEQVSAALQCADIIALPYRDGVSLRRGSLMAALAHGKAIISTQPIGPLPELNANDTMLLVLRQDADALAAAITRLYYEPRLRANLEQHAALFAEQYTWPVIAKRTLEVLHAAVGH